MGNNRSSQLFVLILVALVGSTSNSVAVAENIDPDNDGSQFAYAENVGWVNAEPSGDGGPGVQVGDSELSGWMWAENVGWISLSCENTLSCGTADYGVNNDGNGILSGYAWAENVGWLSFSCENTSSCGAANYGVTINPATGEFSGFAWGKNIGWISFNCTNTASCATVDYKVKSGSISVIALEIDINPGSFPDSINPCSHGNIPVAILTTEDFDATTVDPLSVKFGLGGAVEAHGQGHTEDADGDGDSDLVLHFKTQDTGIQCGDTEATLTGETFDGQPIQGSDSINTVGCCS